MTAEQRQRIKEIFESVLDTPLPEQMHLLGQLCPDDAIVRAEVEALLRARAEADGFLSGSPLRSLALEGGSAPLFDFTGRRIGVYRLHREIGQGGMATVYLAERMDGEYRQQVALKLVWPSGDLSEITRRFKRERQILAGLDHPNIARLLDGGTTAEGWPYLVMEYIAGVPITHYCREHNLALVERLRLFQTVCAAVAYAHRNLVVHRDIKPGNILVTADGVVKLLDFGIAKLLAPESSEQPTITGLRPMTPEYASPEQLREETITTATDVYSLGALLYELLTGAHPHDLKNRPLHEITRIVCEEDPPPPSSVNLQLRGDLDNIVLMALRKDQRQRYQTIEQFSEDISRYLAGEPISARPATLFYRTGKFARRNMTGVAITATVLILLLAGLFISLRQNRLQRYQLYAADMRQAGRDWEDGNLVQMDALLEAHRPGSGSDAWRGFEWFALWKLLHVEKHIIRLPNQFSGPCLTPDGKTLLIAPENKIEIWDVSSGQYLTQFAELTERIQRLFLSQDGTKVAALTQNNSVKVWELATKKLLLDIPEQVITDLPKVVMNWGVQRERYLAFSVDGSRLAIRTGQYLVEEWNTSTGKLIQKYQLPETIYFEKYGPAFYSPDGRLICLAKNLKERYWLLWDLASHRVLVKLDPKSDDPKVMDASLPIGHVLSRDGTKYYLATWDMLVRSWDVRTGRLLQVFRGHTEDVVTVALSVDDQYLVTGSDDKTLRIWNTQTGHCLAVIKNESEPLQASFSANGFLAASCLRALRVKIWDVTGLLTTLSSLDGVATYELLADGTKFLTEEKGVPSIRHLSSGLTIAKYDKADAGSFALAERPNELFRLTDIAYNKQRVERLSQDSGNVISTHYLNHEGSISSFNYPPSGTLIATAGGNDHIIKLWQMPDWREIAQLKGHTSHIEGVFFSPDGQKLASSAQDNTIRIWDVLQRKELFTLKGHSSYVRWVAFSPDGKTLASAGRDYVIRLWDLETGQELRTLQGHANSVLCVAFSPDGLRLASSGKDKTVRLWDWRNGKELIVLHGHNEKVWRIFFTPDGKTLVSSGEESTRIWQTATEEEVRAR